MHQRIHRHEMSNLLIPVDLIDLEELPLGRSAYHESVLRQHLLHRIIQIKLPQIIDITQVRLHRVGFYTRRHPQRRQIRGCRIRTRKQLRTVSCLYTCTRCAVSVFPAVCTRCAIRIACIFRTRCTLVLFMIRPRTPAAYPLCLPGART